MIFAIRVDDVGWTGIPDDPPPKKKPDKGLRLAKEFHEALLGLPWLAAVIPSSIDDEGLDWLRSRPAGLTVALHGFDHCRARGVDNEFHGLDYWDCRKRIRKGLDVLSAVPVNHFVPPFNALDASLAIACADEGLRTIWGAIDEKPSPPRVDGSITFIPAWIRTYGTAKRLISTGTPVLIKEVEKLRDIGGYAVITLHIPWEASAKDGFAGVRELARLLQGLVIDPDSYSRGGF